MHVNKVMVALAGKLAGVIWVVLSKPGQLVNGARQQAVASKSIRFNRIGMRGSK